MISVTSGTASIRSRPDLDRRRAGPEGPDRRGARTCSSTSPGSRHDDEGPGGPEDRDGPRHRRPRARARAGRPPRSGQRRPPASHERSRSRRAPPRSRQPRREDLPGEGEGTRRRGDARADAVRARRGRRPLPSSRSPSRREHGPRSTWLRITLEEGKNRQIRRQCPRSDTRSRSSCA